MQQSPQISCACCDGGCCTLLSWLSSISCNNISDITKQTQIVKYFIFLRTLGEFNFINACVNGGMINGDRNIKFMQTNFGRVYGNVYWIISGRINWHSVDGCHCILKRTLFSNLFNWLCNKGHVPWQNYFPHDWCSPPCKSVNCGYCGHGGPIWVSWGGGVPEWWAFLGAWWRNGSGCILM